MSIDPRLVDYIKLYIRLIILLILNCTLFFISHMVLDLCHSKFYIISQMKMTMKSFFFFFPLRVQQIKTLTVTTIILVFVDGKKKKKKKSLYQESLTIKKDKFL